VQSGDLLLLCSDGLTSMISEDAVAQVLGSTESLSDAAKALIAQANEAGGRDNITVVLFRVEEVGAPRARAAATEEPTMVGEPPPPAAAADSTGSASAVAVAPAPASRVQPRAPERPAAERVSARRLRFTKPVAATVAVLAVLFLVGGGGYLATRQLYFIGTNSHGIVTIYRGLPYSLPAGIPLYETFFVSGVPASQVPVDRRQEFFDNQIRSESSAVNLVRNLELGRVSR
jgi:protein phosphatase